MTDVLVVGAGSAGCALAARLAAAGAAVTLLEAGPGDERPELRDVASLAATAPGHPRNWALRAELAPGIEAVVPRGLGLGGSSAINGAAWTYVTRADADAWSQPGWTYADLLRGYAAAETVLPATVPPPGLVHPATERFLAAATALGYAPEPDKNAGGPPGAGLVPTISVAGRRVDTATAYLAGVASPPTGPAGGSGVRGALGREAGGGPVGGAACGVAGAAFGGAAFGGAAVGGGAGSPPVRVRPGAPVRRVLVERGRAVGVELGSGERVRAGEVVACAGAVGTPRLLLRSGLGADLPVGRDWSDHPAVYLPFRAPGGAPDPPAHPHAPAAQAALNLDAGADPAGDVEILLFVRPFAPGGPLHLMCLLQAPDSRGVLDVDRISYGYLRTEHDRRRLRHAVRVGAELLRAGLGERVEPDGAVLGTDRALDGWIAAHLTTAVHLCGSAGIGRVVEPDLRVRGVAGLRVADTSVLPVVPRRGPAATAVAIGELAASLLARA